MGPTTRNKRRPRHVLQTLGDADLEPSGSDDVLLSLPKEVLDIIAGRLSQQDISTASLACKKWVKLLRSGVADLTTVARVFTDDLFTFESFSLHSIVPNLRQLNLYLTPRSSQEALSSYLGHLDSFQQLQRLDLTFWVPLEPRRGLFPVFFAECLKAPQQLQVLRLDGCPLPDVAMQALTKLEQPLNQLSELIFEPGSYPGGSVAASHEERGYWGTGVASHTGHLPSCASLPSLTPNLRRLHTIMPSDAGADWVEGLGDLRRLTALQLETPDSFLHACPDAVLQAVCSGVGQQLQELGVNLAPASLGALLPGGALPSLPRLQQLDLKFWFWTPSSVSSALSGLATHPAGLEVVQSLGMFPCMCSNPLLEDLGRCTALTKLQLLSLAEAPAAAGAAAAGGGGAGAAAAGSGGGGGGGAAAAGASAQGGMLDLAPLSSLGHLEELVVMQAAEAQRIRWPMVLGSYWPRLRSLEIASSSLTPAALGPLSQWPALTCLQLSTCAVPRLGVLGAPEGDGGGRGQAGEAVLHLEDLGRGLAHLALDGYTLLLNRGRRATSLHQLTHLSLTRCSVVSCVGRRMSRHQQPTHDLPLLLSRTPNLALLHLSSLPGLCDSDFGAIGALTRLTTLSVLAVGNPNVTQGALVSLAGCQGLRVLRWHVGDNADASLPHLSTLQGFQQLLSLHVTPQMDRRLDRWAAYDILDHMRSADVVVEWVNA